VTIRRELDVSDLPPEALDARQPSWWGNALIMTIETSTVALLIMSYLYLWRNDRLTSWPPPKTSTAEAILDPLPDLVWSTLDLGLLAGSCVLMALLDLHARRRFRLLKSLRVAKPEEAPEHLRPTKRPVGTAVGLGILLVIGTVAVVLRYLEFGGLKFSWNENAYASVVWSLLGIHLTYLGLAWVEVALILIWYLLYGFGETIALDVTLAAVYWYWMAAMWALIYAVVYWLPRIV
jgi:heme/copper-type cytochrome/quinol oxidase subunit 3